MSRPQDTDRNQEATVYVVSVMVDAARTISRRAELINLLSRATSMSGVRTRSFGSSCSKQGLLVRSEIISWTLRQ